MVSCVGFIGRGVISSPMSTSSKYTTFPLMSPSLPRGSRLASNLRLLNDSHFLALLVFVCRLTDDEHHLARASGFFIHVGDARLQGDGVARPHRNVELATLSGVKRDLAELHFGIWHLAGTEHIVEDRWGDKSATGGVFGRFRIDILRTGFADGLCIRQHHI